MTTDVKRIDDGGPAFPHTYTNGEYVTDGGMSLRDWFAGQVSSREIEEATPSSISECADMIGVEYGQYDGKRHYPMVCAVVRYRIADAMLAARKSGGAA